MALQHTLAYIAYILIDPKNVFTAFNMLITISNPASMVHSLKQVVIKCSIPNSTWSPESGKQCNQ